MRLKASAALAAATISLSAPQAAPRMSVETMDAHVTRAMRETGANGLALAIIDNGRVTAVRSWGVRNDRGDPLTVDTIMYGASLTKPAFAAMVLQLAAEKRIDLDTSIAKYLPKPLPDYANEEGSGPWSHLAGDERWRKLTPRMLLNHSSGFANFAFLEPDGRLRFHFDPGARYAYSGEGYILLQFVLERGLGLNVGAEMQRRIFSPLGMTRTGMRWRPDFARDLADGWDAAGKVEPHDERSRVRAAGSMDTSISDAGRLAAGLVRGLGSRTRRELIRTGLPITTASQFPTLQPELPRSRRRPDLGSGTGVVVFSGPQGRGFFKGGHNDTTGNTMVCLEKRKRCVVILSNDVRAEAAFPRLVALVLGPTGVPWSWEYGAGFKSLPL